MQGVSVVDTQKRPPKVIQVSLRTNFLAFSFGE